jgi:hypothetical protein
MTKSAKKKGARLASDALQPTPAPPAPTRTVEEYTQLVTHSLRLGIFYDLASDPTRHSSQKRPQLRLVDGDFWARRLPLSQRTEYSAHLLHTFLSGPHSKALSEATQTFSISHDFILDHWPDIHPELAISMARLRTLAFEVYNNRCVQEGRAKERSVPCFHKWLNEREAPRQTIQCIRKDPEMHRILDLVLREPFETYLTTPRAFSRPAPPAFWFGLGATCDSDIEILRSRHPRVGPPTPYYFNTQSGPYYPLAYQVELWIILNNTCPLFGSTSIWCRSDNLLAHSFLHAHLLGVQGPVPAVDDILSIPSGAVRGYSLLTEEDLFDLVPSTCPAVALMVPATFHGPERANTSQGGRIRRLHNWHQYQWTRVGEDWQLWTQRLFHIDELTVHPLRMPSIHPHQLFTAVAVLHTALRHPHFYSFIPRVVTAFLLDMLESSPRPEVHFMLRPYSGLMTDPERVAAYYLCSGQPNTPSRNRVESSLPVYLPSPVRPIP